MNRSESHLDRAGDDPGTIRIPMRFYIFPVCMALCFLLTAAGFTVANWLTGSDTAAHYSAAQGR